MKAKITAFGIGILLALISQGFLHGWYSILPWILGAMATGYMSSNSKDARINGLIMGCILFLLYLLLGYQGKLDSLSLLKFGGLVFIFSFIGGGLGAFGSWLSFEFFSKTLFRLRK